MDKHLVNAISLYKSSSYRQKILACLQGKIMTPSEISRIVRIRLNHISMFLGDMKENGLVKYLNEENKRGRLYELTEMGKRVMAYGQKH